jgi:hypothetical protein
MNYPRYFGFCGVPYYEGKPLLAASNETEYIFYCSWLVDYLDKIPHEVIPECQRELCAELEQKDPDSAAFWLGHDGFYHLIAYETLARRIEDGMSYEEAERDLRVWWEDTYRGWEPDEIEPFDEWINFPFWEDAKREFADKQAMVFAVEHADVGYRVPLARTLARVQSREERLELIHSFYWSFNEDASK